LPSKALSIVVGEKSGSSFPLIAGSGIGGFSNRIQDLSFVLQIVATKGLADDTLPAQITKINADFKGKLKAYACDCLKASQISQMTDNDKAAFTTWIDSTCKQ